MWKEEKQIASISLDGKIRKESGATNAAPSQKGLQAGIVPTVRRFDESALVNRRNLMFVLRTNYERVVP